MRLARSQRAGRLSLIARSRGRRARCRRFLLPQKDRPVWWLMARHQTWRGCAGAEMRHGAPESQLTGGRGAGSAPFGGALLSGSVPPPGAPLKGLPLRGIAPRNGCARQPSSLSDRCASAQRAHLFVQWRKGGHGHVGDDWQTRRTHSVKGPSSFGLSDAVRVDELRPSACYCASATRVKSDQSGDGKCRVQCSPQVPSRWILPK